jgi:hypothetical protein
LASLRSLNDLSSGVWGRANATFEEHTKTL